jgi:hypothetical protein
LSWGEGEGSPKGSFSKTIGTTKETGGEPLKGNFRKGGGPGGREGNQRERGQKTEENSTPYHYEEHLMEKGMKEPYMNQNIF